MAEENTSVTTEEETIPSTQDVENIPKLTNEQQQFINECEKEFANRYTEDDPDYKAVLESSIGDPPIIDPWYNKPKRNYNWAPRRDNRRNDRYDDRRDRYRNFDDNRRDRYQHHSRYDRRDGYQNRGDGGRYGNRYQNNYRRPYY